MKAVIQSALVVAFMSVGFASVVYSQQTAPKDILPPTPQKSTISPTLTTIAPANVSQSSTTPLAVTPQSPAAPAESKPELSLPAVVGTNTVPAPNTGQLVAPSLWNGTNGASSSAWDRSAASAVTPTPTAKVTANPWSTSPASSRAWDSTVPLNSGTKTEWK